MLRNYIKIAWRNLINNKVFSFINIISLSIGLSASFIIGMMVYYDFTFDQFHKDKEEIYRVVTNFESPRGSFSNPGVSVPLAQELKENATGINIVAPFYTISVDVVKSSFTETEFRKPKNIIYTGEEYFQLFTYKWLAGNPEGILERANEVVLSEKRAKKYFPQLSINEIIGKTLVYNDSITTQVTGIVENFKKRSDLVFEEFISIPTLYGNEPFNMVTDPQWDSTSSSSQLFVKISENVDLSSIQKQLDRIAKEHKAADDEKSGLTTNFNLQPLLDIHFNPTYGVFDYSRGRASKSVLWGLTYIAIFLLLLGCINFINLNTAQAVKRSKEIGIRKTLGSSKKQLIIQFLGETFLLTIISALVSFVFVIWLLDVFSEFIPADLGISVFLEPVAITILVMILIIVTLLSGFYPALVLSGFKPISILKNKISTGKSSAVFRSSLTVFQFVVAQVFIIATLLVGKQIHYMMNQDMGFKSEAIAYVSFPWSDQSIDKRTRFSNQISTIPQIEKVSLGGAPPASRSYNTSVITYFDGKNEITEDLQFLYGDQNYLDLYEIPLLAGRKQLNDTIVEFVINETYSKKLGFKNPEEAIGKFLKYSDKMYPIVGVMQDFNQRSLRSEIDPMTLAGDWSRSEFSQFGTVHFSMHKGNSDNWSDMIAKVESSWNETYPNFDFEIQFMDQTIETFYKQEAKMSKLLKWATGLSILISCLGLFGLVIYTTQRRTKEIGIRKVLGASLSRLVLLLCSEFMKLLIIALIIAIPIAFWLLRKWLQEFAYRTSMSAWVFIVSGLGMLLLAIVIMGFRTFKTAVVNPVKSLRTE